MGVGAAGNAEICGSGRLPVAAMSTIFDKISADYDATFVTISAAEQRRGPGQLAVFLRVAVDLGLMTEKEADQIRPRYAGWKAGAPISSRL
jgi:hypothetical protein